MPTRRARTPTTSSPSSPRGRGSARTATVRSGPPSEQLGKESGPAPAGEVRALDMSAPTMPVSPRWSRPSRWRAPRSCGRTGRRPRRSSAGPAFDLICAELASKHNIVPLTPIWYWGWRDFTFTDREVPKPEDMRGPQDARPREPDLGRDGPRLRCGSGTDLVRRGLYRAPAELRWTARSTRSRPSTRASATRCRVCHYDSRHMLQNNTIVINNDSSGTAVGRSTEDPDGGGRRRLDRRTPGCSRSREEEHARGDPKSGRTKIIEARPRGLPGCGDQAHAELKARWGASNLARLRQEIARSAALTVAAAGSNGWTTLLARGEELFLAASHGIVAGPRHRRRLLPLRDERPARLDRGVRRHRLRLDALRRLSPAASGRACTSRMDVAPGRGCRAGPGPRAAVAVT